MPEEATPVKASSPSHRCGNLISVIPGAVKQQIDEKPITIGVRILGPALGFLLGSMCTRIYADPYTDPQIEPTDPRWVGAWWLGLVLVSSLLMLASFAMFAFPKRLRTSRNPPRPLRCGKKNLSLRVASWRTLGPAFLFPSPRAPVAVALAVAVAAAAAAAAVAAALALRTSAGKPNANILLNGALGLRNVLTPDFPKAVKRLLKNDILMFRTASSVLHILPIAGLYTFLPKYLETQFRLPAHKANMISGIGGILVMGLGIIISGVFILRVKPNARFVAAWIAFTAVVYAIGKKHEWEFLCLLDVQWMILLDLYLADCQCISNSSDAHAIVHGTAKQKFCDSKCTNYVWYILLFSVFVFIHSTSEVGSMLLILRCVDPRDKAMALGLIQFAIGLFGNVPCPIVYGAVVDYACMVWEETVCGEQGACWLYDSNIFRMFYHGTTGAILLCAFFVDIIVWYKAGSINFVDEPGPNPQEEELNPIAGRARSETSV
ncbi:Solute carrier organic anion transporter family member [Gryllus bimaculatus]|nr:Solute carrier organic anion transporter family member [Gryllus bimaculatus]